MVDEKLKKRALRHYHKCHNMAKTLRKYPYCSRSVFYTWLKNEGKEHVRGGRPDAGWARDRGGEGGDRREDLRWA